MKRMVQNHDHSLVWLARFEEEAQLLGYDQVMEHIHSDIYPVLPDGTIGGNVLSERLVCYAYAVAQLRQQAELASPMKRSPLMTFERSNYVDVVTVELRLAEAALNYQIAAYLELDDTATFRIYRGGIVVVNEPIEDTPRVTGSSVDSYRGTHDYGGPTGLPPGGSLRKWDQGVP